jgi:hypothetical protein
MDLKKFLKIFLVATFLTVILSIGFLIKDLSEKNKRKEVDEERQILMQEYIEGLQNLDFNTIKELQKENPDIDI